MSDVIEITELADQLHSYMVFRATCEVSPYALSPEYFAKALRPYHCPTNIFGVDVAPDKEGEMRIIRDRLNPDAFTAWRIDDLREGLIALAKAGIGDLQRCIACRLIDLFGCLNEYGKPQQPEQLPRDAVTSVEDYAEMLGRELDHEADSYGSNIWAIRVIEELHFLPDGANGVFKQKPH